MSSSINSVSKFLFIFLFPLAAWAADPFCADPARAICGQKQIVSDQGVSKVAGGFARVRKADRRLIRERALQTIGIRDLKAKSGAEIAALAKLLKIDNWRCFVPDTEACRQQIAERIAEYASRESLLFSDEQTGMDHPLSLRAIESLRGRPEYKTYRDWIRKDSATFRRSPELEKELRSMFPEMVQTFIAKVRSWPIPEPQKSGMIRRLQTVSITFDTPDKCSINVPAPYVPNGNYRASTNEVSICSGMFLASTAPASLAVIVAHEIGHVVGPCFFNQFSPAQTPINQKNLERVYGGLLSCLRERDGSASPGFCTPKSKVNESFADWAGSELAAEYLPKRFPTREPGKWRSRFSGSWSFTCGEPGDPDHAANALRFNQLLFANTRVQALVNCPRVPERECQMGSSLPPRSAGPARAGAVR